MKRVFVSHPVTSSGTLEENREKCDRICKDLAASGHVIPISPLHLFGWCEQETPRLREQIMQFCYKMIEHCDAVYMYGNEGGCLDEYRFAKRLGKPVVYMMGRE